MKAFRLLMLSIITPSITIKVLNKMLSVAIKPIRLCHPLDGITNPKYKLLHILTAKTFLQREEGTSF
jgi:hypothetical protein